MEGRSNGRAQAPLQTRRATDNVQKLVGPFHKRCTVGKENEALQEAGPAPSQAGRGAPSGMKFSGVLTRRAAAAAGVVVDVKGEVGMAKARGGGLRQRDANLPTTSQTEQQHPLRKSHLATKPQLPTQRRSMSLLLQSRSEAASSEAELATSDADEPLPQSPMPDIDSKDKHNPLAAAEYAADIFGYYRRMEKFYRPAPNYMSHQTDINDNMRSILLDWLVEVHYKFKLMPETLFLTTNLIDRFLEQKRVSRRNLQLVGVTAMLVASKYEEIWAPEVKDFVYISDKAYSREQILQMEKIMLNTLMFNLTVPTPLDFLSRFAKAAGCARDTDVMLYSAYLIELAMVDYSMLKFSYSMLSAAAVYAANKALNRVPSYPHHLARHAGYSEAEVLACAQALAELFVRAPSATLRTVYKKYGHTQYGRVSLKTAPAELLEQNA